VQVKPSQDNEKVFLLKYFIRFCVYFSIDISFLLENIIHFWRISLSFAVIETSKQLSFEERNDIPEQPIFHLRKQNFQFQAFITQRNKKIE